MPKIPEYYNIGDRSNITLERLLVILEDMYKDIAIALNKKPEIYQRDSDGLTSDYSLNNGDININTTTLKVEMLVEHDTSSTVVWETLS